MTDNDGTYKYSQVESVIVAMPKTFDLSQNYPNPFNPTTKIDYDLPATGKVRMELYSITGQLAAVLVDAVQDAGFYSLHLNAGLYRLSSGVYFYRLIVTGADQKANILTKKMLLLK